jgi:hypothetical protein
MQVKFLVHDVATPLNPPVAPVEHEKFEKASLDVNVFQRPREEEPSRRVVHTRVDHSAWDH